VDWWHTKREKDYTHTRQRKGVNIYKEGGGRPICNVKLERVSRSIYLCNWPEIGGGGGRFLRKEGVGIRGGEWGDVL